MRPPASAQLRGADWGAPSLWIQPSSSRFCHPVYCCCLVAESCPTLCDRMDCSPPGSSVRGILRARTLRGLPCPSPGDLPDPGADLCLERQQAGSSPVCQPAALTLCIPLTFFSQFQRLLRVLTIQRELAASVRPVCGAVLALAVSVPVPHPERGRWPPEGWRACRCRHRQPARGLPGQQDGEEGTGGS